MVHQTNTQKFSIKVPNNLLKVFKGNTNRAYFNHLLHAVPAHSALNEK